MSFDDNGYIGYDGCFIDAPYVLTKEEYSAKALFDEGLLQSIQNSRFRIDLPYERNMIDDGAAIAFNFGDLLTHVPIFERLKWKEFYRGTDVQIDIADKLLFFDFENTQDIETVKDYWQTRLDNLLETEDQPWLTKKDKEQTAQELHFLKQPDQQTNEYRDIRYMYFRRDVLDKYRNNDLCEIDDEYIRFLRHDKKTSASTVRFDNRNFVNIDGIVLMVQT
jgi:hypothetical protein